MEEDPSARAVRVVLADDTADIRHFLRVLLELDDLFEIVGEAATGTEAVEVVKKEDPDLVILDVSMPDMDGYQAISSIREAGSGARIVVLAAFAESEAGAEAMRRGADAYLEKGTGPTELIAKLKKVALLTPRIEAAAGGEPAAADRRQTFPTDRRQSATAGLWPGLTHELRNYATVIESMAATLLDGWHELPEAVVRRALESVGRNASQIQTVLGVLSDFLRVERGELELGLAPSNVASLVREIVREFSPAAAPHSVSIETPLEVHADVDVTRFRQIVNALLANAARFSPPGAGISVEVGGDQEHATVTVSDRGSGVTPDRAQEIFEPSLASGHRVAEGGIGLYLARALARAHGGDLVLVERERGAAFRLILPRR